MKLLLVVALLALSRAALIYVPGIPVDQMVLYQVQAACDNLQEEIEKKFGTAGQNNYKLFIQTYMATFYLKRLAADPGISKYNNIIYGGGNTASGNKNFMIGSSNQVTGDDNFVFSNDFQNNTPIDNALVLDDWVVKLAHLYSIPLDAAKAIVNWKLNPI